MIDVPAYLARIGYTGPTEPNAETLRSLHRAHMLAVPFENLDISARRPIVCDEERFVAKIVDKRRGGFCYELNGAFAALLGALRFKVTLLSARVPRGEAGDGPEFDHLALGVGLEEPWLADVGFGDSFLEPLRLTPGIEQEQVAGRFRIQPRSHGELVMQRWDASSGGWKAQYVFTLQPRVLSDFAGMCHYHQTSSESHFTQKRICSLATPEGRITLSDCTFIVTRKRKREERSVTEEERIAVLKEYFGVSL
jgi:N-hydroxyarylamine O-acetyltransferase